VPSCAIAARFGTDLLAGTAPRPCGVTRQVMGDDAALRSAHAIVHPAVQQRRTRAAAGGSERGDAIVINDIPLLFESSIRRSSMR